MSAAAIAFLRDAVLQTIGITCGALTLALIVGIPSALVLVRGGRAASVLSALVAFVRAIPDLVLAIIFVVAVGLGPAAGVLALGLHYAAVVAKLFAEILNAVRREAAEAMRATGATATTAFAIGMVPAAWTGLVGFGGYVFESAVRASVIVGVVGAGGIGSVLVQQLNLADFLGFAQTLGVLIVLVVVLDVISERLRLHAPPLAVVGAVFGIAVVGAIAFAITADPPWMAIAHAPQHLVAFAASSWPIDLSPRALAVAVSGVRDALGIALAGTLAGCVLALPLAWVAAAAARARSTLRAQTRWERLLAGATRLVLAIIRAIPCIAVGLIGLSIVGLGWKAGVFALTIHTAGVLGKLIAESLELAERGPAEALAATGASPAAAALIALVPTAFTAIVAHVLYRFEWNVRASTVLGTIGAGGIGQAIFNAQQQFFYHQLALYVIVAIVLVLAIDAAGARLRTMWQLGAMTV